MPPISVVYLALFNGNVTDEFLEAILRMYPSATEQNIPKTIIYAESLAFMFEPPIELTNVNVFRLTTSPGRSTDAKLTKFETVLLRGLPEAFRLVDGWKDESEKEWMGHGVFTADTMMIGVVPKPKEGWSKSWKDWYRWLTTPDTSEEADSEDDDPSDNETPSRKRLKSGSA